MIDSFGLRRLCSFILEKPAEEGLAQNHEISDPYVLSPFPLPWTSS